MNLKLKSSAQAGFTLIELIVVIVILGILAATALPKFADLGGDARKASVQAAKGSLASTASMVHGRWLLDANHSGWIIIEDTSVNILNGYPNSNDQQFGWAAGLKDDYNIAQSTSGMVVSPKSAKTASTCNVTYTSASASSATPPVITPPTYTLNVTDCS